MTVFQLGDSFKELKKRFSDMRRNQKNMKVVRNQLHQEKLQVGALYRFLQGAGSNSFCSLIPQASAPM